MTMTEFQTWDGRSRSAIWTWPMLWSKSRCAGCKATNVLCGKGLSNDKLDEHQLASFDLSWCAAEITGAALRIEYAGRVGAKAHASTLTPAWKQRLP
jgi:hypothetical protein